MKRKLLAVDYDGTLNRIGETNSPLAPRMAWRNALALAVAIDAGHPVAIVTGRPLSYTHEMGGKILRRCQESGRLALITEEGTTRTWLRNGGRWSHSVQHNTWPEEEAPILSITQDLSERLNWRFNLAGDHVHTVSAHPHPLLFGLQAPASIEALNRRLSWEMQAFLDELELNSLLVLIVSRVSCTLVPKGVNKGAALSYLLEELNLKPEQALFIGDSFGPGQSDDTVAQIGIPSWNVGPEAHNSLAQAVLNRHGETLRGPLGTHHVLLRRG